jgi:hypothetical protein
MDPFLLKIKWKNTPLLLIVKRRTGEPAIPHRARDEGEKR